MSISNGVYVLGGLTPASKFFWIHAQNRKKHTGRKISMIVWNLWRFWSRKFFHKSNRTFPNALFWFGIDAVGGVIGLIISVHFASCKIVRPTSYFIPTQRTTTWQNNKIYPFTVRFRVRGQLKIYIFLSQLTIFQQGYSFDLRWFKSFLWIESIARHSLDFI